MLPPSVSALERGRKKCVFLAGDSPKIPPEMAYGFLTPKFELGRTVATAGVAALELELFPYLRRHHCGDWGDLDSQDKQANEDALTTDLRILSKYHAKDEAGTEYPIYIITEWDRSLTTIMLTTEY